MPIIPVIIEQHAEEAAFQWIMRDGAVGDPHYSLEDLAHSDNRVEAHLDGLRIAGDPGWEICKDLLAFEEAGEVFSAAILAFESGAEDRTRAVLDAGTVDYETSRGLVSALGWIAFQKAAGRIRDLQQSESPDHRRVGLAACVAHRRDPGKTLTRALSDEDIMLRARALRAVGELGRKDMLPALKDHFTEKDGICGFFAAWSAAMFNDASAVAILREIAEEGYARSERACSMAIRCMNHHDALSWLRSIAGNSDCKRVVAKGYGVFGDPVAIPWLMEIMDIPDLARIASESFTMITGVDIALEDLEGEWPEGFEAGPTENPEDDDVGMDPDEDLPWPEPERIAAWWKENKGRFKGGQRYILGEPMDPGSLERALRHGYQRQRAAAAIEIAMRNPGQPLFEVRAPGFRQRRILGV